MLLAKDRKPLGAILLPEALVNDKASQALYAAKELRFYLDRITTASFQIEADDGKKAGVALRMSGEYGDDGFSFETKGDRFTITGGKRGVIYGVYELLEELGCRFFTATCEKVPASTTLELPELNKVCKPAMEFRQHSYYEAMQYPRFAVKARLNGRHHEIPEQMGGRWICPLWVHTFDKLIPAAKYGESHPEYFSLVNGERLTTPGGRTQLCLTNPEVLELAIQAVRKVLQENPDATMISISQNDCFNNCECDNCRAVDEEEHSPGGTLLRFVNKIAETLEPEFPNVNFTTLAYQYGRPTPAITHNRHNVSVWLCSIECCFSHPYEKCDDHSRDLIRPDGTVSNFISDLKAWSKFCDRLYVWDYTTCFAHFPMPYPNWRVLQPNLQTLVENNVKGVYEQPNVASKGGVDFNELRQYLICKLMWDPYCDVEKHRKEFMEYFYGAAAPYLDEYLNLICDIVEQENIHIHFNDNPTHDYLTPERLAQYHALFDKAAEAVKDDPLRLWRVEKNRLSIRWVELKRKAMYQGVHDAEEIEKFFADWRAFGLSRIEESCNLETTHRAMVEDLWCGVQLLEHWTGEDPEYL